MNKSGSYPNVHRPWNFHYQQNWRISGLNPVSTSELKVGNLAADEQAE